MSELLPAYENPPVIETVLGIGFEPVRGITSAHWGAFWQEHLRSEYPQVEEKPRQELFSGSSGSSNRRVESPARLWFWHTTREHVVQLQADALLLNWLRAKGSTYRPYAERKARLQAHWQAASSFLQTQLQQAPQATGVLVLYVNHVPVDPSLGVVGSLSSFFRGWASQYRDSWLPEAATAEIRLRFPFSSGESHGSDQAEILDVLLSQVADDQQRVFWRFELAARQPVSEDRWESIEEALDTSHERVVRGFTDLTTPNAHQQWGRTQ